VKIAPGKIEFGEGTVYVSSVGFILEVRVWGVFEKLAGCFGNSSFVTTFYSARSNPII
jgi:hypothetical protein